MIRCFRFCTINAFIFDLVRYAVAYIPKGGSIINVGSIQAYDPSVEIIDYATTKAADFLKKGIRVNCVAPGPVWTPLVIASFLKDKNAIYGEEYSLKRPAQTREIAPAFVFLALAADSSYISGEILAVTGGMPTV